jgi:hypothetical protein
LEEQETLGHRVQENSTIAGAVRTFPVLGQLFSQKLQRNSGGLRLFGLELFAHMHGPAYHRTGLAITTRIGGDKPRRRSWPPEAKISEQKHP